jgi:hypothetical protein
MLLENFLKSHEQELIQLYINERQRSGNSLGILNINLTKKDNADVCFIPITSDVLSEDLKLDIENRCRKNPSNIIYIYGTELIDNEIITKLVEVEL